MRRVCKKDHFNTLSIGELKGQSKITYDGKSKLKNYICVLLEVQPFHSFTLEFLTNNVEFLEFLVVLRSI